MKDSHKKKLPKPDVGVVFGVLILASWILIPVFIVVGWRLPTPHLVKNVGFVNALKGCTIKGNVNDSGEKIYHLDTQDYYDQTIIEPEKGDSLFCKTSDAEKAGFRASKATNHENSDYDETCGPAESMRGEC